MEDLITALGLLLVIEGIAYALFPNALRKLVQATLELPPKQIQAAALAMAGTGLIIVWLVRG
jgi:uncharacterized protein YjeT (DUF2065 family)